MSKINKSIEYMFDIMLNIGVSPERTRKPLRAKYVKVKILYIDKRKEDSTKREHARRNSERAVLRVMIS